MAYANDFVVLVMATRADVVDPNRFADHRVSRSGSGAWKKSPPIPVARSIDVTMAHTVKRNQDQDKPRLLAVQVRLYNVELGHGSVSQTRPHPGRVRNPPEPGRRTASRRVICSSFHGHPRVIVQASWIAVTSPPSCSTAYLRTARSASQ